MADPIRVMLIEDNDVFREAVELLLDLQPDLEIVASLADGSEAVGVCVRLDPDVVVLDYRLPGLDGVQLTSAIRYACPDMAVVCLSASANRREVEALQAAGAVAHVTKDAPFEEIVAAIQHAASG